MGAAELHAHLAGGLGTVARCWAVTRADGISLGFTDHDRDLAFEGQSFRADTGLSAKTLQQATGLSVDNSEAMGALRDDALSEADIEAGRFDGAEVVCWLVNWQDVSQRRMLFRGSIGEIRRAGGAFHAELRGLTEALNRPLGRSFQKPCSAVLGDAACMAVEVGDLGPDWDATRLVIDRLDIYRTTVSGDVVLVDAGLRGNLAIAGGGLDGTVFLEARNGG